MPRVIWLSEAYPVESKTLRKQLCVNKQSIGAHMFVVFCIITMRLKDSTKTTKHQCVSISHIRPF